LECSLKPTGGWNWVAAIYVNVQVVCQAIPNSTKLEESAFVKLILRGVEKPLT